MAQHKIILNRRAHSLEINFLAHSEDLAETSNTVSTNWALYTFFKIGEDKKPHAYYEVRDRMLSENTLFNTESYEELEEWIAQHKAEIQKQIDEKAEEWLKKYKPLK